MTDPTTALIEPLTEREVEVLRLMAEGQNNREIAEVLVISVNTVRWYNKQIYAKLDVHDRDSAIERADALGLLEAHEAAAPADSRAQIPTRLSSFIGREAEIKTGSQLLRAGRLLTLTGPGGTGKTRLSIEIAEAAAADFADGLRFVNLVPLVDDSQVPQAIAAALDVMESSSESLVDRLKRALVDQELLLLIDNFEHVIGAAPLVAELLSAAPQLKILVTSREALRLSGEQEYPVPPLSLPDATTDSLEELAQSEAMTLFVQRASMARPGFRLSDSNASTIAEICARLEGMPLAIELAAARCKLLTPQALLDRLDSPLTTLTGGSRDAPSRQRTLRDTIAWSYDLLEAGEKSLFARLAVFRGGRSLEGVEAVCAEGLALDVFDGLASLLDKSMIRQVEDSNGEPRFFMLDTIQQYAREQLESSGEGELLRRHHASYYLTLAEQAAPELRLSQQVRWFHRLETEHDNFRSALAWSLDNDELEIGVRLAGALSWFWYWHGYHVEGRQWVERFLDRIDEIPEPWHTSIYLSSALMATSDTDLTVAQQRYRKAVDLARQSGDQEQIAWTTVFQAYAMLQDYEQAFALAEDALHMFEELEHKPGIAQSLNVIGEIARFNGDDQRALAVYEACLAMSRETGEVYRIGMMYENLAYVELHRGNYAAARDWARQAVELARETLLPRAIASGLVAMAGAFGATGDPERAARLLSAIDSALLRMGTFLQPADKPEYDRSVEAVRARLGADRFDGAWAEGQKMTFAQAIDEALRE